jgi:purine nucleosidase
MADAAKKIVIIDTDPGVDDVMAILYLAAHADVSVHSLTTVFGNGDVTNTTINAQYIVERFGLNLPVYAGANAPLVGRRFVPELKVHGDDGLGDTNLAKTVSGLTTVEPAWIHICKTVRAFPGKITLLAIGPLTNLAMALRHDPEIADLVEQVVVMGGAFGTNGRRGNIKPNAEANFFYDPIAAQAVLNATWPVTVVGLDVTSDCILTAAEALDLAKTAGDAGSFIRQISRNYEAIYRQFDDVDGFCIHDVAAAAYVALPKCFQQTSAQLTVGNTPKTWGESLATPTSSDGDTGNKRFCRSVDPRLLISDFIGVIRRYSNQELLLNTAGH